MANASRQYGAWETVASNIAEGCSRGWDVTLFASGDSITSALACRRRACYEEDRSIDPKC